MQLCRAGRDWRKITEPYGDPRNELRRWSTRAADRDARDRLISELEAVARTGSRKRLRHH